MKGYIFGEQCGLFQIIDAFYLYFLLLNFQKNLVINDRWTNFNFSSSGDECDKVPEMENGRMSCNQLPNGGKKCTPGLIFWNSILKWSNVFFKYNQFIVHFFYELIFLFFSLQCWARLLPKVQRSSADISLHDKSRRLENPEIYSGLFTCPRKPEWSDLRGRMGGQRRRPPMRRLSTGHVPRTGTNIIVRNI